MTEGPTAVPALLLIDALNVAYWRGAPPSLRLPLALAVALLKARRRVRLVFDASTPFRLPEAEQAPYQRLIAEPTLAVPVPSGVPADRQLLRLARAGGAVIVSRDRFRDHRARYRRLIDDPARLLDGYASEALLTLPRLGLDAPVEGSCDAVCDALLALHKHRAVA